MKEQTDYKAICCDEPMRDMGMWPRTCTIGKRTDIESPPGALPGSYEIDAGDEGDVYCHCFHCLKCNRFIGIAWHQEPRERLRSVA